MGVVMSAEVRQLIFTADKVKSRRNFHGALEFNVPVVLTHLLGRSPHSQSLDDPGFSWDSEVLLYISSVISLVFIRL